MKKITATILALVMAFALAACSGSGQQAETTAAPATETVTEASPAAETTEASSEEETTEEVTEESTTEEETFPEATDDRVITVTDMSGDEVTIEGQG